MTSDAKFDPCLFPPQICIRNFSSTVTRCNISSHCYPLGIISRVVFRRSDTRTACHEHLALSVSNEINLAEGLDTGGVAVVPFPSRDGEKPAPSGRSNHVPLFLRNKLLPECQTLTPKNRRSYRRSSLPRWLVYMSVWSR